MKVILDHKEGLMLLCSQSKSTCSNKPVYTYISPVDDLTIPAHLSFRLHLDKLTNYNDTKLSEPEPFLDIRTSTVVILCSYVVTGYIHSNYNKERELPREVTLKL